MERESKLHVIDFVQKEPRDVNVFRAREVGCTLVARAQAVFGVHDLLPLHQILGPVYQNAEVSG